MSLVGTRPILPGELEQYELHHRTRIAIKPGITGMWQVSGRSDITDFEEVVRLAKKHDILYGKFFAKKAGFISKKWLPVFANYRRDGYDFDALFEDEKAPIKHKKNS